MTRPGVYQIVDEPQPSPWREWTVRPLWPLFAMMLAGPWLALPWFAFNGAAMGSASRHREWWLVAATLPAMLATLYLAAGLHMASGLPDPLLKYFLQAMLLVKLGAGYALFILQSRSFALHEYYGRPTRNGLFLALIGGFLGQRLVADALGGAPLLRLLLT